MIRHALALSFTLTGLAFAQETRPTWIQERVATLSRGSEKDALGVLFFLEDFRSADVAAWRLLLERQGDRKFFARVLRGLGRVGEPGLKPLLVEILDHHAGPWTRDVQRAAGLAVGLFGDPELLPKLAEKATPRDVFFAVGLIKKLPASGRERIVEWKEPEGDSRPAPETGDSTFIDPVEAALRWGAAIEEPVFAELARRTLMAADASSRRKTAAVDFFARSKPRAPADLRPPLMELLRADDPELSGLAARALAKSDGAGGEEAAAIEAAFSTPTGAARIDQARALAALQIPRSFEALERLLALTKGAPAAQRTVLESLKAVAGKLPDDIKKSVARTVRAIVQPGEREAAAPPDVQAAAVVLLAAVDPGQFQALLPAFRLSATWQVRAAAAGGVLLLPDPRVWRRHDWFFSDPDRRVRIAMLEAMAQKPPRSTADDYSGIIWDLLHASRLDTSPSGSWRLNTLDPVEIGVTASLLDTALDHASSLHPPPPKLDFDWFPEVAARNLPHHEVEALQAVLDLAGKLKSEAGSAVLRGFLESPEISLRKRAKGLLSKNGIEANEEPPVDERITGRMFEDGIERGNRLFESPSRSAVIETNRGNITIALFPSEAPATVDNFLVLGNQGFYDGILWHRVVPAFVAQAGCPRGDGWGGPGYTIRCEVNDRTYRRGSVGMALAGKDTGGSQFFICHRALPHLDGRYTLFGQVTDGMDVVDRLGQEDYIIRVRAR